MNENPPAAPSGLKADGKRLWDSVVGEFDLMQAELDLLERACRCLDHIGALDRVVERDGMGDPSDPTRIHPALVEARMQSQVFGRLIAALRLPSGDEDVRPQYRGPRGFYRMARSTAVAQQRLKVVK